MVWGRVVEQVRQSDLMPQWARYYDEGGALVRTITFSDFQGPELTPSAPYAVILPSCTQEDLDKVRIITGPASVRGSHAAVPLGR